MNTRKAKELVFFIAHLDDFEFSCFGFLFEHHKSYETIKIIHATTWEKKEETWKNNLKSLPDEIKSKIQDINLGFPQRRLMENFDNLKDKFYERIDFKNRFDLITHDSEDCHTDHVVLFQISKGIFKYANRFITIYSPSSINFGANYFIGLSESVYELKKGCLDQYDISKEQSFTKLGYYLQSEEHYNIARTHVLANYAFDDFKTYEIYRILKWL